MKILSLFDGISCAKVSAERMGFNIKEYHASEIDKYAIEISKKNHPNIIQVGDVKEVDGNNYKGYDLLIGGSPCQDLSIASRNRKGLKGKRSGLFYEYERILNEAKPKYFILENVASMKKEDRDIITKCLGVEPIMINAALVSAQQRKRLFWTNIEGVTQPKDRRIYLKDILEDEVDDKYFYNSNNKINTNQGNRAYSINNKSVSLKSLGGGGGAKTGLYVAPNGKRMELEEGLHCFKEVRTELGKKKRREYRRLTGRDSTKRDPNDKKYIPQKTGKANCITTAIGVEGMISSDFVIRKLTPLECERLQGLPDDYTKGVSNTQRYKCLGNAFNVDVVAHILNFIKRNP